MPFGSCCDDYSCWAICSSRAIRASVGGWVENNLANDDAPADRPLKGLMMNMWAWAGDTDGGTGTCRTASSIFLSALASASGSWERYAPDSSAWYSRGRETAIWINAAAMAARIQAMSEASW